jgi:hypothetical protein
MQRSSFNTVLSERFPYAYFVVQNYCKNHSYFFLGRAYEKTSCQTLRFCSRKRLG